MLRSLHWFPAFLLVFAAGVTAAEPGLGGGRPLRIEELPRSGLREELILLTPEQQARAMGQLAELHFTARDCEELHADRRGNVFFKCAGLLRPAVPVTAPIASALTGAALPISAPPSYHSRPGAACRIYLDFNGATVSGTQWNDASGVTTYAALPYSLDSDLTTFSAAEQADIQRIWQRIAEDYAPFEIDVTTDVAVESSFNNTTGWVVITPMIDANGKHLPHYGAGGIAYPGVFGRNNYHSFFSPAWVSSENGGGREDDIAEAAAHEMGHNFGLSHDGTSAAAYYFGHGAGETSWGPIMGAPYDRNMSQWSRGEYPDANNHQDDLAIIASHCPYRTDDYASTDAAAVLLPSSTTLSATGVIERTSDVDVLAFAAGAGPLTLTVDPFRSPAHTNGGNLDVLLQLYDANGTLVASADPATTTGAVIATTVPVGVFYLHISGTGALDLSTGYSDYGSLGQWTLSGTVTSPPVLVAPAFTTQAGDLTVVAPATATFTVVASGTPSPTYQWQSAMRGSSIFLTISGATAASYTTSATTAAMNGTRYRCLASNAAGNATSNAATLNVQYASAIVTAPVFQVVTAPAPATFTVVADGNPAPTYSWECAPAGSTVFGPISGATLASYTTAATVVADSGKQYHCVVSNSIGNATTGAVALTVNPPAPPATGWTPNGVSGGGGGGCGAGSALGLLALALAGLAWNGVGRRRFRDD